mmetsp:Transcript_15926/g.36882  ORF Transcript_15926/g.36882 Transcript_15926/m.36882 type:complete len:189 (-) Transcript_15926:241-807(-)
MAPVRHASAARAAPAMATLAEIKADSGVTAPLGYFDPLSLMTNPAQLEKYSLYKESEIKHGRVAMLAAPGFLIAEKFHPLFGGNVDAPSILAFQQTPLQTIWPIVLLVIGAIEGYSSVSTYKDPSTAAWSIKEDHLAGDLGMFGGAKQAKSNPAGYKALATKEINNGRLAMMAIAGMVVQELVFHVKL